jgi:hypothetical protein
MSKISGDSLWQLRRRAIGVRIVCNLALMAVAIVPLYEALLWAVGSMLTGGTSEDVLSSALFSWLLLIVPALGYAAIQQAVAAMILKRVPDDSQRRIVIVICVILLPTVVLFGTPPGFLFSWATGGTALLAAVAFGAAQSLPARAAVV